MEARLKNVHYRFSTHLFRGGKILIRSPNCHRLIIYPYIKSIQLYVIEITYPSTICLRFKLKFKFSKEANKFNRAFNNNSNVNNKIRRIRGVLLKKKKKRLNIKFIAIRVSLFKREREKYIYIFFLFFFFLLFLFFCEQEPMGILRDLKTGFVFIIYSFEEQMVSFYRSMDCLRVGKLPREN